MNKEEIKQIILDYVLKEYIDDDDIEISTDTPLISSGYVDSFSMVSLLIFIEHQFNIKIPPNEATPEAFDSVDNIFELVCKFLKLN